MPKARDLGVLSFQEAVNNLEVLGGINLEAPLFLGVIPEKYQFIMNSAEEGLHSTEWLSGEGMEVLLKALDVNIRTIYTHLQHIYSQKEAEENLVKQRRGLQTLMDLCGDAVYKLSKYLAFRLNLNHLESEIEKRASYRELQKFYQKNFSLKFSENESWQEDWQESPKAEILDFEETGLKDFESVRRDLEYELFFIRDEEDQSYFTPSLLRNIKLACHFEMAQGSSFEEDPLLRIRAMLDRDAQSSAHQITEECHEVFDAFYHLFRRLKRNVFAQHLSMAVSALYLAANPYNLVQRSSGKSCLQYFQDFHSFLRSALQSNEYQKCIDVVISQKDEVLSLLLELTHRLCEGFFMKKGGIKQEVIGLLHRCMRKGGEADPEKLGIKATSFWSQLLIDDEKLRTNLLQFPNGPLFKILDLIAEDSQGFDPYSQQNEPHQIFSVYSKSLNIDVLRMPSPVIQRAIQKITIAPEFYGFLRRLKHVKKKHLLVNLQERNSWVESARSQGIENLQKRVEFSHTLMVITLPKNGEFYHQIKSFSNCNQTKEFIKQIELEIANEQGGFFFTKGFDRTRASEFASKALPVIWKIFFSNKTQLDRREREDFIEIFYQFLVLKVIEEFHPTSISFTCKDSVDVGASSQALFFGFIQLLTSSDIVDSADFLRWLLYAPALLIRERPIHSERLTRTLSALETISLQAEPDLARVKKEMAQLFSPKILEGIGVRMNL